MNDRYTGLELANRKGQDVSLVFSKPQEGSKSKYLLYKRLELTGALQSPIFRSPDSALTHSEYLSIPKMLRGSTASAR